MSNERFPRIDELFRAALALPAAQRKAFVNEQCGDDDAMRREVEALLAEDDATRGALDAPVFGETFDVTTAMHAAPVSEGPGTRIGPYKILQQIGEGGFGTVFMAEQSEPIIRRVALKIIKLGMDTKQVIARFEAERQALAIMDHANIAKVFDAGATQTGRPYFVMEMCAGAPITEYCDKNNLSIDERLELFAQVCRAVQHAHQKGVIHRDIKPSNVLVSTQDGQPLAKVIDFGIAKATNMRLTEKTMFTEHRQLIGTPEYMSPEQAEGALDIDTRTDVYSLGVLLYELLTGSTPFDQLSLRRAGYAEIQRIIREVDPPHPSTRLSQSRDTIVKVAASRHTEPKRLGAIVRGELDWIVMKALDKDRKRRYETASELAADIGSFRTGQPINAAPPSTAYRMRKFVRRNKGVVTAASVVAATLVLGVMGTSGGLVWALNEKSRADGEAARAVAAQAATEQRAEELEQVAEFQQSQLAGIDTALMGIRMRGDIINTRRAALEANGMSHEAVEAALAELRSALAGVNFTNIALNTLDENIFERAIKAIDDQFQDQPLVRARLLQTVAATLRELGLLDRATEPQAEALDIRRRTLGDEHPDTLDSINNMGRLLRDQGRLTEAEPYFQEALDGRRRVLSDDHPDTLASISNMGLLLRRQGMHTEAEPYWREALEGRRRVLGDEHPDTLRSISNMGALLGHQGKLAEAEPYYREALKGFRRVRGEEHPDTLGSINNMAFLLVGQNKLAEAEPYLDEAVQGYRRVLGDEHPSTLTSINNMGMLLQWQGQHEEAEPYVREAMTTGRRVLGDEHLDTLTWINNMGVVLVAQGKLAEAEPYYREALEGCRRVLGEAHLDTLNSISNLGGLLYRQGKLAEAEPYYREALKGFRGVLGEEHPDTLTAMYHLARCLRQMAAFTEAETLSLECEQLNRGVYGDRHRETIDAVNLLIDLYDAWHEHEPSAGHDATAAKWRVATRSEDPSNDTTGRPARDGENP